MQRQVEEQVSDAARRLSLSSGEEAALADLLSACDGTELRFVQQCLHLLEPADAGLVRALFDVLPDKAIDAFLAHLRTKISHASLKAWHEWISQPRNAGVLAPAVASAPKLNVAAAQIYDDLVNALQTRLHQARNLPDDEFYAYFVMTDAERQHIREQGGRPEVTATRLDAAKRRMEADLAAKLPLMRQGLDALDDDVADILLSFRAGRRRWRLTTGDWHELGTALSALGAAYPVARAGKRVKQSGVREKAEAQMLAAPQLVERLCLFVSMRGKLMHLRPHCDRNPHLIGLLHDQIHQMPLQDARTLLHKWRTIPAEAAEGLLNNVLLFGRVAPPAGSAPADAEVLRYVSACLTDVMAARMPRAHAVCLVDVLARLGQEDPGVLRGTLELVQRPSELSETALMNRALYYTDPASLGVAWDALYLEKCREIWSNFALGVDDLDEELIAEIVPMLIDKFVGAERTLSGASIVNSELVVEIAAALGVCRTADLMRLKNIIRDMAPKQAQQHCKRLLQAAAEVITPPEGAAAAQSADKAQQAASSDLKTPDLGSDITELATESDVRNMVISGWLSSMEAVIDDTTPAGWMPMEILPWSECDVMTWKRTFNEIVYRLNAAVFERPAEEWTYTQARYMLLIAEQMDTLPPDLKIPPFSNFKDADELQAWIDTVCRAAAAVSRATWLPMLSALRWSYEGLPRTVAVSIAREFGPLSDTNVLFKTAYSHVRASEPTYGLTTAARVLRYDELVDVAHHVAATRLRELGAFGEPEYPRLDIGQIARAVQNGLADCGGDVEEALQSGRFVGHYLDVIPSAEAAVDTYMASVEDRVRFSQSGEDVVEYDLKMDGACERDPQLRRLLASGRVTQQLSTVGPGMLIPGLVQKMLDCSLEEFEELRARLDAMHTVPTYDDVQSVLAWCTPEFLGGIDLEREPLKAWARFEEEYGVSAEEMREYLPEVDQIVADRPEAEAKALDESVAQEVSYRAVEIDAHGRSYATGRRKKNAVARVWLSRGAGDVVINGKPFAQYFPQAYHRSHAMQPILAIWKPEQYNVWATVEGGGKSCQAQALRLGIARALVKFDPECHPTLKRSLLLKRDPRVVERKKPAQKKARKKRQWVKR